MIAKVLKAKRFYGLFTRLCCLVMASFIAGQLCFQGIAFAQDKTASQTKDSEPAKVEPVKDQPRAVSDAAAGDSSERLHGAFSSNTADSAGSMPNVGSAEESKTKPDNTGLHVVTMRISGSLCYSCLLDLEKTLKRVEGIVEVKVDKERKTAFQPFSPDLSNWASASLRYDSSKTSWNELRSVIRVHGYVPYKVSDRTLGP